MYSACRDRQRAGLKPTGASLHVMDGLAEAETPLAPAQVPASSASQPDKGVGMEAGWLAPLLGSCSLRPSRPPPGWGEGRHARTALGGPDLQAPCRWLRASTVRGNPHECPLTLHPEAGSLGLAHFHSRAGDTQDRVIASPNWQSGHLSPAPIHECG